MTQHPQAECIHRDMAWMNRQFCITGIHRLRSNTSLPPIRGFVRSEFNPLIYHSAKGAAEAAKFIDESIPMVKRGVLLGSMFTDSITQQETSKDLLQGKKISPIMFPQSVPSAIIGYLAKELNIHGPMSCLGSSREGAYLMLLQAADWLAAGDADAVILIFCDTPSFLAAHWVKKMLNGTGGTPELGGGAISIVMEMQESAEKRNVERVLTVEEFYRQMNPPHPAGFHGMASGLESTEELCS